MKEFIEKLIGRLEKYKYSHLIERDSEMLEHCKEKEMDCEGSDCFLCVWDKATEIVNQLAEEYINCLTDTSSGWIPCSERLPEEPEEDLQDISYFPEYNVTINGAEESTTLYYMGDGEWSDVDGDAYDVIAWMPLPPAYVPKEGRE